MLQWFRVSQKFSRKLQGVSKLLQKETGSCFYSPSGGFSVNRKEWEGLQKKQKQRYIIRKTKRCGFPKRKVSKIRKFQKRNVFYLFKHTRGRETQKQPVSLPLVLYIQFKPNIIFTGNQTDSLINVILVNMNITEV